MFFGEDQSHDARERHISLISLILCTPNIHWTDKNTKRNTVLGWYRKFHENSSRNGKQIAEPPHFNLCFFSTFRNVTLWRETDTTPMRNTYCSMSSFQKLPRPQLMKTMDSTVNTIKRTFALATTRNWPTRLARSRSPGVTGSASKLSSFGKRHITLILQKQRRKCQSFSILLLKKGMPFQYHWTSNATRIATLAFLEASSTLRTHDNLKNKKPMFYTKIDFLFFYSPRADCFLRQ